MVENRGAPLIESSRLGSKPPWKVTGNMLVKRGDVMESSRNANLGSEAPTREGRNRPAVPPPALYAEIRLR